MSAAVIQAASAAGLVPPEPAAPSRLWPRLSRSDVDRLPPTEWHIADLIARGLVVIYGPSGARKSFLAMDWSFCTATGHRWFGKRVAAGPVLYVAAEGSAGVSKRVAAWESDRQELVPDHWHLIPQAVLLLRPEYIHQLVADVRETRARLLVLDTWARCLAGGDENSTADVTNAVERLGEITRSGCTVLVVHHTGYERSHPRGATALFAAADTVVKVHTDDDTDETVVVSDKQKDAAPFRTWRLAPREVADSLVLTLSQRRDVLAESTLAAL